jgi:hypothetical protein
VQPIRPGRSDGAHFLTEFGEIGGQKRRGDERRGLHDSLVTLRPGGDNLGQAMTAD